jgi:hypothetical protein
MSHRAGSLWWAGATAAAVAAVAVVMLVTKSCGFKDQYIVFKLTYQ